jgi:hypothetical protein
MFIFGSGNAYATPYGANAPGSPTPLELGVLQETGVEFATSQKELYGKQQFPLAVARTAGKVNLTFKFANVYLKLWNDLFFGSTVAAGSERGVADESHVAAASVTIAPPSSGVFARDMGVRDATTGKSMTLVLASPVAGVSYEVNTGTGVYTFNASQGASLISYTYTLSSTGFKSNVTNQPMGSQPVMDITIFNTQYTNLDGSFNCLLRFPAVIAAKMGMPMKNEDWQITDFACAAFADNAGNIMYLNADE